MPKNEFICDCTVVHEEVVEKVKKKMMSDKIYQMAADFFKIFGDLTRIKIVSALDESEMCVCDIANTLSMTKSAVSHQLSTLREAGLVTYRREGKTVYYSLADDHVREILEDGMDHILEERDHS